MNKFNWVQYLQNYPDLVINDISTKEECYQHYRKYGFRENRTDQPGVNINTTTGNLGGRLGNVLFYNIVCNFLAKESDLKMTYKQQQETEKILDIKLYTGSKVFNSNYILTDQVIDLVLKI